MEFEKITALLLKLNVHDKEFLSPSSIKMATERVTYFFLVYTIFSRLSAIILLFSESIFMVK